MGREVGGRRLLRICNECNQSTFEKLSRVVVVWREGRTSDQERDGLLTFWEGSGTTWHIEGKLK